MADKYYIIKRIYFLWIIISICLSVFYFFYNLSENSDYLPTYIIFILISIICLFVFSKINIRFLIYSLPVAYLIVGIFFKYHKIPDLLIFSINRIILLGFIFLPDIEFKYKNILKTIYLNILFFIVFIEILLFIIFNITHIDILKRKNEIIFLSPGKKINNVKINKYGFLGDNIDKISKKQKWIFIGDSQGVGIVDYKYNFINMLGDSLNICDINLSRPGSSPYDYYNILKSIIHRNDIDKIFIILFSGNDIQEWFIPENNKSIENMRIVNFIRNVFLIKIKNDIDNKTNIKQITFYDICYNRANIEKIKNEAIFHRFDYYIKKIINICKKNNKQLYFIIIPSEISINTELQDIINNKYKKINDYLFAHKYIINTLNRMNAKYFDVYEYFNKSYINGDNPFEPFNTHLNRTGNYILFKCIVEWIKNETFDKK